MVGNDLETVAVRGNQDAEVIKRNRETEAAGIKHETDVKKTKKCERCDITSK